VILVGIDDTDTLDTPGTNQLARRIAQRLPPAHRCRMVLRHQLFVDPRVPYTSHNCSASLLLEGDSGGHSVLVEFLGAQLREWFVPGSDPGLCVAHEVPDDVVRFAHRCRHEVVRQDEARALAAAHGLHLEGFGGTNDGVIGALAAVGLMAEGRDGRVIHLEGWRWPDQFAGPRDIPEIEARGVHEVREAATCERVTHGTVDVGRHLRPNVHDHRIVLWVERADRGPDGADWVALKLP
jgi:tRNA(Ile2) C34 agmatinyltransferase TiaS